MWIWRKTASTVMQNVSKENVKVNNEKNRVCPVSIAGGLDNRLRRWIQNPRKILGPYVKEGMKVLDIGCGPGFFSIEMARLVGKSGKVIALDLQEGMLRKLSNKIQGTELEKRVTLHKCEKNSFVLPSPDSSPLPYHAFSGGGLTEASPRHVQKVEKEEGIEQRNPPLQTPVVKRQRPGEGERQNT